MAMWRLSLVQQVRQTTAPRTPDRAGRIREVAGTTTWDWRGRPCTLSERTLCDWIARYEARGLEGVMRKAPRNAGIRRVCLSRRWDDAMRQAGVSDAQRAEITETVRGHVRSAWRSGTPSWPTVQLNVLPKVVGLTQAAGVDLPDPKALHELCEVPRRFIEAERRYTLIAMKEQDAAGFAAKVTPRIHRDRSRLRPCEWVAGDVHHIDMIVRRPDGTECTPKAVAWLDLATNRVWLDVFIMPKGEMIRTEHVIQSFVGMCSDPNWGVPSRLYLDNGSEYKWTNLVNDIAKLKRFVVIDVYDAPKCKNDADAKAVQHALPYNAQAKVIETSFATIERVVFSQLPGYIGGNRMQKKTANQGRAPKPFPGDEARLKEAIATGMAYYHAKPQAGHLNGISPNDSLANHIGAGWRSTVLDPRELAVAFSRKIVKPVRAGGTLRLDSINFRADALQSYVGSRVIVRQPLTGDRNTLFVFTEYEDFICTAGPETTYVFGDPRGAGEQSRRAKVLRTDLAAMAAGTERIDGEQAMANVVALHGPAPTAQSDGVISINPEYSAAAQMARTAPARSDGENDRNAEQRALLQRLVDMLPKERLAG
jgi:hypothetical protein